MEWKSWLWQALMVIVVVVLVLAFLQVLENRFRFDPVSLVARPFKARAPMPDGFGGGGDASNVPMA